MDFQFSEDQERLRREVRQFLDRALPAGWAHDTVDLDQHEWPFAVEFTRKLARKSWVAPAWPTEYGGLGFDYMSQVVMAEEMAYRRAPNVAVVGVTNVGPSVLIHGSEWQKSTLLPSIASGDAVWCQGFSEPDSGSDLASLKTAAVPSGDDYVINGEKIWTSLADHSQWCCLLARTDPGAPKHKGITCFAVPMNSDGIRVEAIFNLAGNHRFNRVYFDNVRVPASLRIGEENAGWQVALSTLGNERSNITSAAIARRLFDDLVVELARQGSKVTSQIRNRLANIAIEIEIGRLISYRVASIQARNLVPDTEASMAQLYHAELLQRVASAATMAMGMSALPARPSSRYDFGTAYLESASATILSGTSEIQRSILAQRGFGLPR